ncbi:MAG: phage tail protein [Proteobacteria bacterium]|nr:phage tail protein [Pseudomonadota bacterium]
MSQDDFTHNNQSRTALRIKLQTADRALASLSKGPGAPPALYDGMFWLQDNLPSASVWTLWVRKPGGWIKVGTIDTVNDLFLAANANAIPVGAGMDYWGTIAPGGFLFPYGQVLNVADFPALGAVFGNRFGGDGITTFGMPDKRGRASFGKDDMGGSLASRITTAIGGIAGAVLGAFGGNQAGGGVAAHTHPFAGTVIDNSGSFHPENFTYIQMVNLGDPNSAGVRYQASNTNSAGTGGASILPPGIVCNYIIKST